VKRRKFRSLEVVAKQFINSYNSGGHLSSLHDSLIDVDTSRQYQPGDKRLDSRSSLRSSQTMSRVFNPERGLTVFLMMDISASHQSKAEAATMTALYLNYLADMANDPAGMITFSDRIYDVVEPSYDTRHLVAILEQWYEKGVYPSGTVLDPVLRLTAETSPTNSMVVLLSDFYYDISDRTVNYLKSIASGKGNSLLALVFFDPNDWIFEKQPFMVDFIDAETNDCVSCNMSNTKGQSKVFTEWRERLRLMLRRGGAEPIFIDVSQENFLLPLVRYLLRG
jgi:hypothetical protein